LVPDDFHTGLHAACNLDIGLTCDSRRHFNEANLVGLGIDNVDALRVLGLLSLPTGVGAFEATLGDGDAAGGVADFSTIDSSGTASTLFLVLVVIVAVELMPGRRALCISLVSSFSWRVTLNSLASCTFTRLDRPPV
jgi:hypothetical protein